VGVVRKLPKVELATKHFSNIANIAMLVMGEEEFLNVPIGF
jgi:hypothetical protein